MSRNTNIGREAISDFLACKTKPRAYRVSRLKVFQKHCVEALRYKARLTFLCKGMVGFSDAEERMQFECMQEEGAEDEVRTLISLSKPTGS